MNKKQFKQFMNENKLNKVIRTNMNYPRRTVDYSFKNNKDSYSGKLNQPTFISLQREGKLKLAKKTKLNEYTYKYIYDYLK